MSDPQHDQQSLQRLRPFFHQYVATFVKNLSASLPAELVKAEDKRLSYAAGYLFFRHFFPGMDPQRLPQISSEMELLYKRLLGEREALGKSLVAMKKDLTVFQEAEKQRQLSAFQAYLDTALKEIATLSGREAVTAAVATPEEKAAREQANAKAQEQAQEDLFNLLAKIKERKSALLCFNLYQDVPISYEATVLQVLAKHGQVALKVHRYQATVIEQDRFTYLKHDLLPGSIKANLVAMKREAQEAIFDKLEYSTVGMDERSNVRVRPRPSEPLEGLVTTVTGQKIKGLVQDLSMGGMGLLVERVNLDMGLGVEVDLKPRKGPVINLHGTVVAVKDQGKKQTVLGLKVVLDTNAEVFISQYVYQRQAEVVRELQQKSL
ncbi:MAG: PilZ domain-containing protein [Magnetococcales bacterium]|nr:PilZ domain-containing protein [Magnetococcales bacterium]